MSGVGEWQESSSSVGGVLWGRCFSMICIKAVSNVSSEHHLTKQLYKPIVKTYRDFKIIFVARCKGCDSLYEDLRAFWGSVPPSIAMNVSFSWISPELKQQETKHKACLRENEMGNQYNTLSAGDKGVTLISKFFLQVLWSHMISSSVRQ